jgi:hypothetical protein
MEKPKQVKTAVRCMWMALALPLVSAVVLAGAMLPLLIIYMAPQIILLSSVHLLPIYFISRWRGWKGRAWARLLYAVVIVALPVAAMLYALVTGAFAGSTAIDGGSVLIMLMTGGSWGLSLYAVVLMYRQPGRQWFLPPLPSN